MFPFDDVIMDKKLHQLVSNVSAINQQCLDIEDSKLVLMTEEVENQYWHISNCPFQSTAFLAQISIITPNQVTLAREYKLGAPSRVWNELYHISLSCRKPNYIYQRAMLTWLSNN